MRDDEDLKLGMNSLTEKEVVAAKLKAMKLGLWPPKQANKGQPKSK